MPFSEIVKSVRAELYDRAVSPLMGSFILSWCAVNFKFILLIFADLDIGHKYYIIDDGLYSDLFETSWNNPALMLLIYPSVMSLIYIFIYPKAAIPIFQYSRERQKEMNDIKKEIDGEILLTREQSRNIRSEIYESQEEFHKELSRKDAEIEGLKSELKSTLQTIPATTPERKKETNGEKARAKKLSVNEVAIMHEIGVHGKGERDTLNKFDDRIEAKFIINKLTDNGYLISDGGWLKLTKEAISYLAKNQAA